MQKDDVYYTLWQTGLIGPYYYDPEIPSNMNSMIFGDEKSLEHARIAFDLIANQKTITEEYDYVRRIIGIVSHDTINEYIDLYPSYKNELNDLKKYSIKIIHAVYDSRA